MDSDSLPTAAGSNSDSDTTLSPTFFHYTLHLISSDDPRSKLEAARDIRCLTKTSQRCGHHFSAAVSPLIGMLYSHSHDLSEVVLFALLNLAVKYETYVSPIKLPLPIKLFPPDFRSDLQVEVDGGKACSSSVEVMDLREINTNRESVGGGEMVEIYEIPKRIWPPIKHPRRRIDQFPIHLMASPPGRGRSAPPS